PSTLHYSTADFLDLDPSRHERFDVVLFSEIVEHLVDPAAGMELLKALLDPSGSVFFTTATNAAFYDHQIVFPTLEDIEAFLDAPGFCVDKYHSILATRGPNGRDVMDYVAVMRTAR